jgi:hypothetical protein
VRERVVEGAEGLGRADFELELLTGALVSDGDLDAIAELAPQEGDLQAVVDPFGPTPASR